MADIEVTSELTLTREQFLENLRSAQQEFEKFAADVGGTAISPSVAINIDTARTSFQRLVEELQAKGIRVPVVFDVGGVPSYSPTTVTSGTPYSTPALSAPALPPSHTDPHAVETTKLLRETVEVLKQKDPEPPRPQDSTPARLDFTRLEGPVRGYAESARTEIETLYAKSKEQNIVNDIANRYVVDQQKAIDIPHPLEVTEAVRAKLGIPSRFDKDEFKQFREAALASLPEITTGSPAQTIAPTESTPEIPAAIPASPPQPPSAAPQALPPAHVQPQLPPPPQATAAQARPAPGPTPPQQPPAPPPPPVPPIPPAGPSLRQPRPPKPPKKTKTPKPKRPRAPSGLSRYLTYGFGAREAAHIAEASRQYDISQREAGNDLEAQTQATLKFVDSFPYAKLLVDPTGDKEFEAQDTLRKAQLDIGYGEDRYRISEETRQTVARADISERGGIDQQRAQIEERNREEQLSARDKRNAETAKIAEEYGRRRETINIAAKQKTDTEDNSAIINNLTEIGTRLFGGTYVDPRDKIEAERTKAINDLDREQREKTKPIEKEYADRKAAIDRNSDSALREANAEEQFRDRSTEIQTSDITASAEESRIRATGNTRVAGDTEFQRKLVQEQQATKAAYDRAVAEHNDTEAARLEATYTAQVEAAPIKIAARKEVEDRQETFRDTQSQLSQTQQEARVKEAETRAEGDSRKAGDEAYAAGLQAEIESLIAKGKEAGDSPEAARLEAEATQKAEAAPRLIAARKATEDKRETYQAEMSQQQVADTAAQAEEGLARAQGDDRTANAEQLARTTQDRINQLRALADATQDAAEKQNLKNQADAAEKARPQELRNQQIANERQTRDTVQDIGASTEENRLRAQGRFFEASELAANEPFRRQERAFQEQNRPEELAATQANQQAAEQARAATRTEDARRIDVQAQEEHLRNQRRDAEADLLSLKEKGKEEEFEAGGDPQKLDAIKHLEAERLRHFAIGENQVSTTHSALEQYLQLQAGILKDPTGAVARSRVEARKEADELDQQRAEANAGMQPAAPQSAPPVAGAVPVVHDGDKEKEYPKLSPEKEKMYDEAEARDPEHKNTLEIARMWARKEATKLAASDTVPVTEQADAQAAPKGHVSAANDALARATAGAAIFTEKEKRAKAADEAETAAAVKAGETQNPAKLKAELSKDMASDAAGKLAQANAAAKAANEALAKEDFPENRLKAAQANLGAIQATNAEHTAAYGYHLDDEAARKSGAYLPKSDASPGARLPDIAAKPPAPSASHDAKSPHETQRERETNQHELIVNRSRDFHNLTAVPRHRPPEVHLSHAQIEHQKIIDAAVASHRHSTVDLKPNFQAPVITGSAADQMGAALQQHQDNAAKPTGEQSAATKMNEAADNLHRVSVELLDLADRLGTVVVMS